MLTLLELLAVSCVHTFRRYVNGALVQDATRGDGTRGDDVTSAALLSHAVPSHLPSTLPSGQHVPGLLEVRLLDDSDVGSNSVIVLLLLYHLRYKI